MEFTLVKFTGILPTPCNIFFILVSFLKVIWNEICVSDSGHSFIESGWSHSPNEPFDSNSASQYETDQALSYVETDETVREIRDEIDRLYVYLEETPHTTCWQVTVSMSAIVYNISCFCLIWKIVFHIFRDCCQMALFQDFKEICERI